MPARKKATSRKSKGSAGGGFNLGRFALMTSLLVGGVVAGYLWRSYFPLALPFESPLVADGSSTDLSGESLEDLTKAATTRAEKAEKERDQLASQIKKLEDAQKESAQEIADLKIKNVLGSHGN